MPTKYKDYPIYTYDEPAVYSSFIGGINTDPSNEHLHESEMRDCVNMHYLSGALVKRKGAKKICDISCEDDLEIIQGIFLFTNKLTYIIIAADGKLYQGIYNPNTTIELSRLLITRTSTKEDEYFEYNEKDPLSGLYKDYLLTPSQVNNLGKHDGYIQLYLVYNEKRFLKNDRTEEAFSSSNYYYPGDIIKSYNNEYLCIKETEYDNAYNNLPNEYFVKIENINSIEYNLVFQNYRKVEAATINNKLYVATGTRIIEIELNSYNELKAHPLEPYLINGSEQVNIGYNYVSPYPEHALTTQYNTVTTSVFGIKTQKLKGEQKFLLTALMNIQSGDSKNNYKFRWEKYYEGKWYVVIPFNSQTEHEYDSSGNAIPAEKYDYTSIQVDDADSAQYRVTFGKAFKIYSKAITAWSSSKGYKEGNLVSVDAHVYECMKTYSSGDYPILQYGFNEIVNDVVLFREIFDTELVPYLYKDADGNYKTTYIQDDEIDEVDGEYFGSATSVVWEEHDVDDTFLLIHSCTKVMADGDKLLFYGDNYNSGQWFKTIIKNPSYITDRGGLSFKTTKNEEIVKVVPFQGNIIVFANSESAGGSIHLVSGNGDDYNDGNGYYSPYQRKTINASISCDNENTIQICDNLLVFKYFDRVYYINASELNNEVVKVVPCNKRVITNNSEVAIPWNDNDCISEVTDTYYALVWKEKYSRNSDGSLLQERPGIRVKMYYNMSVQYDDNSYGMPWLRDESDIFNSQFIINAKGKPLYLYNNILVSFDEDNYNDLGTEYECKVHFRGEGLNYPQQFKLIDHIIVGFSRNQYNKIDLSVIIKNEAGHVLLDTDSKRFSLNDLGSLRLGQKLNSDKYKLGLTIQDMKLLNTINMFPCLLADTIIKANTKGSFTLSSVTYQYTSCDQPDTNPYDTYSNIIRPKEVK